MKQKLKICVVLVDRANYGRLFPVMHELKNNKDCILQTICSGTMMLEKFGYAERIVQKDGFKIHGRVHMEISGSIPETMSKSIGLGVIGFTQEYQRLNPDIVLIIGDRYEALSATIAAAYMNISIAHIQGGEISGSIDESTRHLITKLAHLHFPSTARSKMIIERMGEDPKYVFNYGCPSSDYLLKTKEISNANIFSNKGIGKINALKPFFLVIFHPVTTSFSDTHDDINELLDALNELKHPTVWLWPNIDAGSDKIAKKMRVFREHNNSDWLCFVKNLHPKEFQSALKSSVCAIGNSSSFVRDSSFYGTPVVLLGDRQNQRECADNVVNSKLTKKNILNSISSQLSSKRYKVSKLYGSGNTSQRIVKKLLTVKPKIQKTFYLD